MAAATASTFSTRPIMRWVPHRVMASLFIFSSVLLAQMSKGDAALSSEEQGVLELLRQEFNQENWTADPCDSGWVTCSNSSQVDYVQTINLEAKNLTGIIPADIGKLRRIRNLILSTNKLEGPIPDFSNMTELTTLDLSTNRLSGRIPDTSAFTNITQILLTGNNFSGGIPASLFQHASAIKIELQGNPLGGPIPDTSELINLDTLNLKETDINGSVPESVNKLAEAGVINFRNNPNLKGVLPDLSGLYRLGYFDAGLCGLTGSLPRLESSRSLFGIYLEYNDFSGPIPLALFQHPTLQWLHLSNNPKLSGEIPDMSQISGVEIFNGSNCNFSGPLPPMEANTILRNLQLANNRLTSIPSDLRNLTKLEVIDVSNNRMAGNLPELPARSTQTNPEGYILKGLNFTNNDFSGEIPESWTELTSLTYMRLGHNRLSGQIPAALGNLMSLQELNLANNLFSGPIPEEIGRLQELTVLDLRNNQFNGTVPETLTNLTKLRTLRLDNNYFTGIPESLVRREGLSLTYGNNANIRIIGTNDIFSSSSSSALSPGTIVGIAVGVLVAIIALLGIVFYANRRRNIKHEDQLSREDMPKSALAFTLKQIKAITENHKTLIGKGGFGPVYHGRLPDGKEVAVKVRALDSKQGAEEFLNEVRLLSRLHHRNVVPLVGYCLEAQQHILVYNYMPQGTLHSHLYHTDAKSPGTQTSKPLDWKTRLDIAVNAARGLEYLHKDCNPPIIHRDVKSSNILLTEKLQAKVADLGISKQAPELDSEEELDASGVSTAIKGTFGYLDPEYFVRRRLTTRSDVYSFGVVLLEIITGKRPQTQRFPNSAETNLIDWVRDAVNKNQVHNCIVDPALKGQYNKECVLKIARTALSCVSPSGAERPNMGEIVHTLIEALQMEGLCVDTSTSATEITVPFSGELQLETPVSSRSPSSSTQSYPAHSLWDTDPRSEEEQSLTTSKR